MKLEERLNPFISLSPFKGMDLDRLPDFVRVCMKLQASM